MVERHVANVNVVGSNPITRFSPDPRTPGSAGRRRTIVPRRPFSFLTHQRAKDGIQHIVESLARILGEESQHKVTVFLKQGVFTPITPVGVGIGQMLRSIQFDGDSRLGIQQVHFHMAPAVERNG